MNDLIEFIRTNLDDDERVALAIQSDRYGDNGDGGWKHWEITQYPDRHWPSLGALGVELAHSYADNVITPQRGEHIVRWDPARALAEVESKRRILDDHEPLANGACDRCCEFGMYSGGNQAWPCTTVRLLALPYADRDGYREEWRP